MSIITLDFETFYDKDYSLSKLTTEQYINDPRFEIIGLGLKVGTKHPAQWFSGDLGSIKKYLSAQDWGSSIVICHNAHFDAAILQWKLGICGGFYTDTISMARAVEGPDVPASLAALAKRFNLGQKGEEVGRNIGKHRKDFSQQSLADYGAYCINDVELTYKLFTELASSFPESELELIDKTIRMFVQPSLKLDATLLKNRLDRVKLEKSQILRDLMETLKCATEEEVRKKLSSGPQFAEVLKSYGIQVPYKKGKNGEIPALAKNDLGFIALEESEDPFTQQLCAARLGVKSTLEESRIERFIGIHDRNEGYLPVPLKYYAAHPGRWGGMDSVNLQNLPTRDKNKKTLKNSIIAPDGYYIVNADLSQIEARLLAWLAGQEDVVRIFRQGLDIYAWDASQVYGKRITKENNPEERFVGKTMRLGLGYGTGPIKLQRTLETGDPPIKLSLLRCNELVWGWRMVNQNITDLWEQGNKLLRHLMSWPEGGDSFYFGKHELIPITPYGIRLPNGLYIRYSNLRTERGRMVHDSRKGPIEIWGGVVTENVVQALARIIIGDFMNVIGSRYKTVLTVHDSLVFVVKQDEVEEAKRYIESVMTTTPPWATGLPIAVDIKHGVSYGDC